MGSGDRPATIRGFAVGMRIALSPLDAVSALIAAVHRGSEGNASAALMTEARDREALDGRIRELAGSSRPRALRLAR